MSNTKNYDPKSITLSIDGQAVSGFADGTFITVNRNNPMWSVVSGASGEHARSKSCDKSGTIELVLMQTSETNDLLSAYLLLDETSNSGKFPVALLDAHGGTIVGATEMWVQQAPSIEYGKELSDRTWTLEAGHIDIFAGGTDISAAMTTLSGSIKSGSIKP